MSRTIFPGYAADDAGSVVAANTAACVEHAIVTKIDRERRTVTMQLTSNADFPQIGHAAKIIFNQLLEGLEQ